MLKIKSKSDRITVWEYEGFPQFTVTLAGTSDRYYVNNGDLIIFDSLDLEDCRRFIEYVALIG